MKVLYLPVFLFGHKLDEDADFDVNASVVFQTEESARNFAESKVILFESMSRYKDFHVSYCVEQLNFSRI